MRWGGSGYPPWGVPRSGYPPGGVTQTPPGGTWPPRGYLDPQGGTQVRVPPRQGYLDLGTPPGGPGNPPWGGYLDPPGGLPGPPPGWSLDPPGGYPGPGTPPGGGTQTPGGVPRSGYPPGGYPGPGTPPGGGTQVRVPPQGGGTRVGQQKEYSLHGGRYASCVHAGGLSC